MDENKDNIITINVEVVDNGIVIDKPDYCEKFAVEEKKSDKEHQKAKSALGEIIYNEINNLIYEFQSNEIGIKIEFFDNNLHKEHE